MQECLLVEKVDVEEKEVAVGIVQMTEVLLLG